jgi:hypothetical protein
MFSVRYALRPKEKFLHLRVALLCEVRSDTMETFPVIEKLRSLYVKSRG